MNKNELKKILESKGFKVAIYIIGIVFVVAFIFQAGVMVGFKKASFSKDWGRNYERNFGPKGQMPHFLRDNFGEVPNAHGAIGKIIKMEFPEIVVLDKDQTEKIIVINDNTSILERNEKVSKDSLALDKYIVVIGSPNDQGQIEAKLIRIIPSPEDMMREDVSRRGFIIEENFNNKNI